MGYCPVTGKACNKTAIFTITEDLGDKKTVTSCCRDCASELVQIRNTVSGRKTQPTFALITGQQITQVSPGNAQQEVKRCPACRWSVDDILRNGKAGCAECFTVFERELEPYMKRTNVKKKDADKSKSVSRQEKIDLLRAAMDAAIKKEDYEEAIRCRDEIAKLEENGGSEGDLSS